MSIRERAREPARDVPNVDERAPLWRVPAFAAIWTGQTASLFGDQVTGLALPWLILLEMRSPLDAGLIAAARYAPVVALGLVAGTLADRLDRRRLVIASDLARALALGVVAVIGALRHVPALWVLALVVLVLGAGQLFFQIAYQAWLPEVTGEPRLGEANAAVEAADAASVLVGYPLAGALITAVGPTLALGADALSFLVSAVSLGRVRTVPSPRRAAPAPKLAARGALVEALAGMRAIVTRPEQRLLKGAGAALHLAAGAIGVLLATLTQLQLHLGLAGGPRLRRRWCWWIRSAALSRRGFIVGDGAAVWRPRRASWRSGAWDWHWRACWVPWRASRWPCSPTSCWMGRSPLASCWSQRPTRSPRRRTCGDGSTRRARPSRRSSAAPGGRRGGAGRARQSTHGLRGAGGLLPAHGAGNGVGGVATVGSVKVSATGRSDRVPLGGIGRASVESRAPVRQTGWGTCRLSQPGRRIRSAAN